MSNSKVYLLVGGPRDGEMIRMPSQGWIMLPDDDLLDIMHIYDLAYLMDGSEVYRYSHSFRRNNHYINTP